jgi:hypothetical protein
MQRAFILFLFFFLSMSSYPQDQVRRYVNSKEDFYIHTANHVDNVNMLTEEAFARIKKDLKKYRSAFGIPSHATLDDDLQKLLMDYMALHDEAKLNTNKVFYFENGRKKAVINDLYTEYGKLAAEEVVNVVNSVDKKVGLGFYAARGISETDWRRAFLEKIEKFTDGIERGSNPVTSEEMGRVAYSESGRYLYQLEQGTKEKKPASERAALKAKAKLAIELEEVHMAKAQTYVRARERFIRLNLKMKMAGILPEYLDDFASFELIKSFEKKHGKILDPWSPALDQQLKDFFFKSNEGREILASRIHPTFKREALSMIENGEKGRFSLYRIEQVGGAYGMKDCKNLYRTIGKKLQYKVQ